MIHPCRSLCEKVYSDCKQLMDTFGITWPEELECSRWVFFMLTCGKGGIFIVDLYCLENLRQNVKYYLAVVSSSLVTLQCLCTGLLFFY